MKKLILASTSPRRIELMKAAGFIFDQVSPQVEETPLAGESPQGMVRRLSRLKANVVFEEYAHRSSIVVLGADTTVVSPGKNQVLGKPQSIKEAREMLARLQGRTHLVLTAYTLMSADSRFTRVVTTRVSMRSLTASEIKRYVDTGEPMDKAGGYAAQGIGSTLIEKVVGSYSNVIGLPITHVIQDLRKMGYGK